MKCNKTIPRNLLWIIQKKKIISFEIFKFINSHFNFFFVNTKYINAVNLKQERIQATTLNLHKIHKISAVESPYIEFPHLRIPAHRFLKTTPDALDTV